MRLINADMYAEKLDADKLYYVKDEYAAGYNDGLFHAEVLVNDFPIVDAIPVSFIFDKMSTINSEYINIQRLIDTEPETAVKRIGIATNLLCEYNALWDLIRAWKERKEE